MSHSGIDDESTGATTIQQQENCHIESRAGRLGSVSGESKDSRDVQIAIGEAPSQRTNSNRFGETQRGTTAGGILSQLIEEARDQLVYHESQIKKLTQRLEHLQQLYEEQQQDAAEDDGELGKPD